MRVSGVIERKRQPQEFLKVEIHIDGKPTETFRMPCWKIPRSRHKRCLCKRLRRERGGLRKTAIRV